jgi:hypothetical protein
MTTSQAGGKITGILALTCSSATALTKGDPVKIVGDYAVAKATALVPVIGYVSVANVRRSASTGFYPSPNATGDVTIEAIGFGVKTMVCAGALAAGIAVAIDANGKVIAANGTSNIGVLLTASTGADDEADVLLR